MAQRPPRRAPCPTAASHWLRARRDRPAARSAHRMRAATRPRRALPHPPGALRSSGHELRATGQPVRGTAPTPRRALPILVSGEFGRNWRLRGNILVDVIRDEPKITQLLHQLRAGDSSARGELMDAVYATLRRLARGYLRKERSDHTLQPTALVNEVYLKLFGRSEVQFVDRAHFFAVVSQAMRRILVDHARMRAAARREGERMPLNAMVEVEVGTGVEQTSLLDLDLALEALAQEKSSLAELIEMRYFGGMTADETAEVVGRSVHVVRHELRIAHAWLRRELAGRSRGSQSGDCQSSPRQ